MIASHRRRHRLLVVLLGPLALGLLLAAWAAREGPARVAALPAFASADAAAGALGSGDALWQREDLFVDWPARVTAYASTGRAAPGLALELKPLRPLVLPDVLLYWSHGAETVADRLPQDAHLLGRIGGPIVHRFALPAVAARGPAGQLVLYSLGHQEVVASATLPALVAAAQVAPVLAEALVAASPTPGEGRGR